MMPNNSHLALGMDHNQSTSSMMTMMHAAQNQSISSSSYSSSTSSVAGSDNGSPSLFDGHLGNTSALNYGFNNNNNNNNNTSQFNTIDQIVQYTPIYLNGKRSKTASLNCMNQYQNNIPAHLNNSSEVCISMK
jgi:hypothetical protein